MTKMNADLMAKVGETLERLAADLSAGKPELLKAYMRAMARFHRYSYGNTILITLQKPDATIVAGFRKWKKMERHVKKGEHGIAILVPVIHGQKRKNKKKQEEVTAKHDQPVKVTEMVDDDVVDVSHPVGYRTGYVFDISQTDGEPLPDPFSSKGIANEDHIALMEVGIRKSGAVLKYSEIVGAYGTTDISSNTITIDPAFTGVMRLQTLAHEWAHFILHRDGKLSKKIEELQAEATAVAVCAALGYDVEPAGLNYLSIHGITAEELKDSIQRIHFAVHTMLEAMSL